MKDAKTFQQALDWGSPETEQLRAFLNTPTGKRAAEILRTLRPRVKTDTVEQAALTGALLKGYDAALEVLLDFLVDAPKPAPTTPEAYPDLDDDAKWPQHLQP